MHSDAYLLKRTKAGDREALAALYGRYLPSVWRYVYAQLRGDEQTCRDVVSETFLAAIRGMASMNGPVADVGPWLIGIARHKVIDCKRLALRQVSGDVPDVPAAANDPAAGLEAADTRWMVGRVMEQMDDGERTVLEWKYIEELSIREIAQRLDRTEKAVEAMLYRARNSFRGRYERAQGVES